VRGIPGHTEQMTGDSEAFDAVDRRIIDMLRQEARISWRELGERVHLSATAVGDRVRRLERNGVIEGYSARVDPAALGRGVRALVEARLAAAMSPETFEAKLATRDEVSFAAYVTGQYDYSILVDCAGPEGLDAFIRWLKAEAGATRTESRVVLRRVVG
jgi:Lrp/AsnC family transcriptional regulator, leucine-responsive regulatory protein